MKWLQYNNSFYDYYNSFQKIKPLYLSFSSHLQHYLQNLKLIFYYIRMKKILFSLICIITEVHKMYIIQIRKILS